ncbi:hypothetical protein ACKWTF_015880 [Chironomus riparius]
MDFGVFMFWWMSGFFLLVVMSFCIDLQCEEEDEYESIVITPKRSPEPKRVETQVNSENEQSLRSTPDRRTCMPMPGSTGWTSSNSNAQPYPPINLTCPYPPQAPYPTQMPMPSNVPYPPQMPYPSIPIESIRYSQSLSYPLNISSETLSASYPLQPTAPSSSDFTSEIPISVLDMNKSRSTAPYPTLNE